MTGLAWIFGLPCIAFPLQPHSCPSNPQTLWHAPYPREMQLRLCAVPVQRPLLEGLLRHCLSQRWLAAAEALGELGCPRVALRTGQLGYSGGWQGATSLSSLLSHCSLLAQLVTEAASASAAVTVAGPAPSDKKASAAAVLMCTLVCQLAGCTCIL